MLFDPGGIEHPDAGPTIQIRLCSIAGGNVRALRAIIWFQFMFQMTGRSWSVPRTSPIRYKKKEGDRKRSGYWQQYRLLPFPINK